LSRQSLDVTIFGHTYTLSAESEDEKQHIKHIASVVDTKMLELSEQLSLTSTKEIAILTALNLANELVEKNSQQIEQTDDNEQIDRMIQSVDHCLKKKHIFLADTDQ